jgi:endonuclease/exonuclease/phosphatase family metal-dependent hydrolase
MEHATCRKPVAWTSVQGVLVGLLLVAALVVGSVGPGLANDWNDGTVRVMTRNLYQGASLDPLLGATSQGALFVAAGQAYQDILDSKPAERAAAVAREIARNRVDLVGLQEAIILRTGPSRLTNPFVPATTVQVDGLQLLLRELQKLGERYHVVAIVPGLDAQLPTFLGFDARLTVRTAIIARSDRSSDLELSNIQVQGFLMNRTFSALGGAVLIPNPRGWASVDVEKNGRKFRFATTHLEADDEDIRSLQAFDMIAGAANTTLPLVFVGDFNVTAPVPSDPTYGRFLTAGFVDAWTRKRPSDQGFTCCQAPNLLNPTSLLNQRIDLVLFRGAFHVDDIRLVGEKPSDKTPSGLWPSDHAGVVATLRIPRN